MAITETISVTGASAAANPTATISDVIIEYDGAVGDVSLQVREGANGWQTIHTTSNGDAVSVSTPDASLEYQFYCRLEEGDVNVYFGP